VWIEVPPDEEPGVAWYRELASSSRSDDDAADEDDPDEPLVPGPPVDTLVVAAMIEPSPTKAARLMTALRMRARRAGCRRRRRVPGARSAGTGTSIADVSSRSLNTATVKVLRDPWAGS
jgi:hypothetical protein